uniref:Uncharacterized protein n=1 Tax=Trichogramma kaykai TaxID=54128 RepID=A0ABD2WDZ3_9HYME
MGKSRYREDEEERLADKVTEILKKMRKKKSTRKEITSPNGEDGGADGLTPKNIEQPKQAKPATPNANSVSVDQNGPTSQPLQKANSTNSTDNLSEDVLNLLGQRIIEKRNFAPSIHPSIAERWSDIIKVGLPKEERAALVKKYFTPENCTFLDPPTLNKEVELAVNEPTRARDQRIVTRHSKLQSCVASITTTISTLIERKNESELPLIDG